MRLKEYQEKLEAEKQTRLKMTDEEILTEVFGDAIRINSNHEKAEIYNKELKRIADLGRKDILEAKLRIGNMSLVTDMREATAKSWSEQCKGKKNTWIAKLVWE